MGCRAPKPAPCPFWGSNVMSSTDMPGVLASETAPTEIAIEPADKEWFKTALTVLFTAAAVLLVSFIAVVTGLV